MRILITNDDAVHASQLIPLIRWCKKLGEVTVLVPKYEQSGKSHSIEIHQPYEVKPVELVKGVASYTVDSSPADCVRFAVFGLKMHFDLVISGINRGFNMGTDIMYSGTAGAIFEAVSLGMKGIALSTSPEYYDRAAEHLDRVFSFILDNGLLDINPAFNVNIPPQGSEIRITQQGGHYYSDDFKPVGNDLYLACGKCVYEDKNDLTLDTDAVSHGYISIMPMTINRTATDAFEKLKKFNA